MAVVEERVSCPACDAVVEVTVADDRSVVGTGVGHSDGPDVINQLCVECMDKIHVRVA